jgi:hypothetical protein
MPSASAATAAIVKLGLCRNIRSECLRSLKKASIQPPFVLVSVAAEPSTVLFFAETRERPNGPPGNPEGSTSATRKKLFARREALFHGEVPCRFETQVMRSGLSRRNLAKRSSGTASLLSTGGRAVLGSSLVRSA